VDTVFHVAAKAGVGGSYQEYFNANFLATKNLMEGCKSYGIQRFVYTSTPSVVFNNQNIRNGNESLPYLKTPISPYAFTKARAEQLVLESHRPREFQTLAIRPHLVWGKEDPHLLPKVITRHRQKRLRIIGVGKNKMDLTHVSNVAHAHICAYRSLKRDSSFGGKPYFIGQNEPVELWPWLNDLFKGLKMSPLNKSISFRNAYILGWFLEKIWGVSRLTSDPPMTRFVASQLAHDHWFSSSSAKKDLHYEPVINMKDAMEDTLPWLKSL
jgi:nucleoside-diphosphate-sugar epimerase